MKILKQGSEKKLKEKLKETLIKKHRIMTFDCYWCGCRWEADIDNGEVYTNKYGEDYAICPFCKRTILHEG